MNTKKLIFLMLALLMVSVASMNAQVRIGGTADPNESALLDLNTGNSANPANNLGLSLPRVSLTAVDMYLKAGIVPLNGTMVYNTNNTVLGVGIYYWLTNQWVKAGVTRGVKSVDIPLNVDSTLILWSTFSEGTLCANRSIVSMQVRRAVGHTTYRPGDIIYYSADNGDVQICVFRREGAKTKPAITYSIEYACQ